MNRKKVIWRVGILSKIVMLFWLSLMISLVTYQMFIDITAITYPAATAYAALTGLLTAVLSSVQWFLERKLCEEDS